MQDDLAIMNHCKMILLYNSPVVDERSEVLEDERSWEILDAIDVVAAGQVISVRRVGRSSSRTEAIKPRQLKVTLSKANFSKGILRERKFCQ